MTVVGPVIARMRAAAPRELAWDYLADPDLRATWWPDSALDVRFGGAVSERWSDGGGADAGGAVRNAVGAIDLLIAGHALGFRWRDGSDDQETAVLITLRSHADETEIMVTETGFGVFADAHERTADATQSWIDLLTDLAAELRHAAPKAADVDDAEVADTDTEAAEVADAGLENADVEHADMEHAGVEYAEDETGEHTVDVAADADADTDADAEAHAADAADAAGTADAGEPDAR